MKTRFSIVIGVLAAALLLPAYSNAKLFGKKSKKEEVDIYELSIDENIVAPKLEKQSKAIADFQNQQYVWLNKLANDGFPYQIKKIRNGEVLSITIPSHNLFAPDDTVLSEKGKSVIKPLLKYLNIPRFYKIVLVMHSDNTGNDIYTMRLTTLRVNSVHDWLGETDKSKTDFVVPYALGSSDPIVDNNSVINRAKNRRLVIYLIPDVTMINQAKRGKITL